MAGPRRGGTCSGARAGSWRCAGGSLKYVQGTDGVDHLFNVRNDLREQADVSRRQPDSLASMRAAWEAINATLLPYPG